MSVKGILDKLVGKILGERNDPRGGKAPSGYNPNSSDSIAEVISLKDCEFTSPSPETMEAVKARKPLTIEQIKEVMKYIECNLYVGRPMVGRFYDYNLSLLAVQNYDGRVETAAVNIAKALSKGEPIDIDDALWYSTCIYVDSENPVLAQVMSDENGDVKIQIANQTVDPTLSSKVGVLKQSVSGFNIMLFNDGRLELGSGMEY